MPVALIFLPFGVQEKKQVLQRKSCGVETAKPRVAAKPWTHGDHGPFRCC